MKDDAGKFTKFYPATSICI